MTRVTLNDNILYPLILFMILFIPTLFWGHLVFHIIYFLFITIFSSNYNNRITFVGHLKNFINKLFHILNNPKREEYISSDIL